MLEIAASNEIQISLIGFVKSFYYFICSWKVELKKDEMKNEDWRIELGISIPIRYSFV